MAGARWTSAPAGILAITLAKLGAQNVTAVDIDPIVVSAAREMSRAIN